MQRTEARYKKLEANNDLFDLSRSFINIDPGGKKSSKKANKKLEKLMMRDNKFLSKSEVVAKYPKFAKDPRPPSYNVVFQPDLGATNHTRVKGPKIAKTSNCRKLAHEIFRELGNMSQTDNNEQ